MFVPNSGRNRGGQGFSGGGRGGRGNGRGRGNSSGGNVQQNSNRGRSNNCRQHQNQRGNEQNNQFSQEGIAYKNIEQICTDMDSLKILSGSSDLLKFVQGKGFSNRLNNLWPEVEKQTKFLKVIVLTASASQADVLPLTHAFLDDVLSSTLIEKIVEKISPLPYSPELQKNPAYSELIKYTVRLLLLGFESLPSKMDIHLTRVHIKR